MYYLVHCASAVAKVEGVLTAFLFGIVALLQLATFAVWISAAVGAVVEKLEVPEVFL